MLATYVGATSFTVLGNLETTFTAGRRVKCNCGADGYKYGTVVTSVYSDPSTTVTLSAESDDLTSNLTAVEYGVLSTGDDSSIPEHDHASSEGYGGNILKKCFAI